MSGQTTGPSPPDESVSSVPRSSASAGLDLAPLKLGRLRSLWNRASSSLWFLPSLLAVAAIALSIGALMLDRVLGTGKSYAFWAFGGNAEGARTILSVIAGSLVSVIALSFSVTIIAIQQASTQYTPRILRNFTRDRGNQLVLGTYVATFTYALLILQRVRAADEAGNGFVPSISISIGMALSLVSLGLLIYFIHHVSESLQVSYLLDQIRRDVDGEIDRLYPDPIGRGLRDSPSFDAELARHGSQSSAPETTLRAHSDGYLAGVDGDSLMVLCRGRASFLTIEAGVGSYVRTGDVVMRAWGDATFDEDIIRQALLAFDLERDRSVGQDPLFGLQQLVDIGVKALSPGINDPTTAVQAIDQIGAAMMRLVARSIPSPLRTANGLKLLIRRPDFSDYVAAAFDELRRAARSNLRVTLHLLSTLDGLLEAARNGSRADCLRRQRMELLEGFAIGSLTARERETLIRKSAHDPAALSESSLS